MNTTIKRIFSCLSVLTLYVIMNIGIPVKAAALPFAKLMPNKEVNNTIEQNNFVLYNGANLENNKSDKNTKLADHYSHYSHYSHSSHQSHYSSRF